MVLRGLGKPEWRKRWLGLQHVVGFLHAAVRAAREGRWKNIHWDGPHEKSAAALRESERMLSECEAEDARLERAMIDE